MNPTIVIPTYWADDEAHANAPGVYDHSTKLNATNPELDRCLASLEQVRDICPAFALSAAAAAVAIPVGALGLPAIGTVVVQVLVVCAVYLAFAKLFHVEELEYLLNTLKELKMKKTAGAA